MNPDLPLFRGLLHTLQQTVECAEREAEDWVWESDLRERVFSCASRLTAIVAILEGRDTATLVEECRRDIDALKARIEEERRVQGSAFGDGEGEGDEAGMEAGYFEGAL